MQKTEEVILPKIQLLFIFWYRYVDDVLSCIELSNLAFILSKINFVNSSIQFTIEIEVDKSINFSNLNILRDDNGYLQFKIFRKPNHTDKYLHFSSYHPQQHKNSDINSLLTRSYTLCNNKFKNDEKSYISKALQINEYDKKFISKISRNLHCKFNDTNPQTLTLSNNSTPSLLPLYFSPIYSGSFGMNSTSPKILRY